MSGLRFIFELAHNNKNSNKRPAPTITIWLISLYVAFYGITVQMYESKNTQLQIKIETSMRTIQLMEKKDFSVLIKNINKSLPVKPDIIFFPSTFKSFFGFNELNNDNNDLFRNFDSFCFCKPKL
jgi:hypothetical protein